MYHTSVGDLIYCLYTILFHLTSCDNLVFMQEFHLNEGCIVFQGKLGKYFIYFEIGLKGNITHGL